LLLMKIVTSSWTLLFYLSAKDSLYWRKLWTLGIDIALEIYIISICVVAANAMWKGDDGGRRYLRHSSDCNISISHFEETISSASSYVPLPPVGYGPKRLGQYFYPLNLDLGTKVWVLLDVVFSLYILSTEKIPELLTRGWNSNDLNDAELTSADNEPSSVFWFGLSKFGHARLSLIFLEDTLLRVCRIIVGLLILLLVLNNQRSDPKKLRIMLMANIVLLTFSIFIYFILFGLFEDLSITDHFYQVEFTGDILLRFILVAFLTKYVESRRLEEFIDSSTNNYNNNNHFNETTN